MKSIQLESGLTAVAQSTVESTQIQKPNQTINLKLINDAFNSDDGDSVELNFQGLYQTLTITSKSIIDKLNEILKAKLPNGVQSLSPSDVTPETTSDNIVKGVTSLFSSFAKQNADLSPEDLVSKFIELAKGGVETGYGQAKQILGDYGAFEYAGVEEGISSTKDLIMKKLDAFAAQKLEELTGKPASTPVPENVSPGEAASSEGKSVNTTA